MEIALWFAYHEPNLERGTSWLARAGGEAEHNAAIAGGLMGARDGEKAVPVEWVANVTEAGRIARVAERLVGLQ
jgi:ADP-ribosylglycohydrolase